MDVFAFYDCSENAPAGQAAMVTLWERGWRNRGWSPRLITARHARRSKFYAEHKNEVGSVPILPLLALHTVGGGWLSPLTTMNFDFSPVKLKGSRAFVLPYGLVFAPKTALQEVFTRKRGISYGYGECVSFGETDWLKSPLVHFPDISPVLDCGRSL